VPIEYQAGWAVDWVWMPEKEKDFALTGFQTWNRQARSQSLYRLRYFVSIGNTDNERFM
jgi:hypothetical protein